MSDQKTKENKVNANIIEAQYIAHKEKEIERNERVVSTERFKCLISTLAVGRNFFKKGDIIDTANKELNLSKKHIDSLHNSCKYNQVELISK